MQQDESVEVVVGSCDWYDLPCNVSSALDWLFDLFQKAPQKFYADIVEQGVRIIEEADVPAFVSDAVSQATALGSVDGLGYMMHLIAFREGLVLMLSAMVLRFTWSWLPFVGR